MFLKQSLAYTFRFGPFLDESDGKTAETGLTIEDSHIRVSKAGGNFIDKAETSNSAHDEAGFYVVVLNGTDTNTVGELQIACHVSGALPVFKTFQVVETDIYAAIFADGATLAASVADILQDTATTIPASLTVIDDFLDTEIALILADTGELQGDWVNGGRLDLLIDSIISKVDVVDGIVDDILVDTGTTIPGTIATVDTVVDAVKVVTDAISTNGSGLSAVPWNAAWDAEVQSEVADGLAAYDPPTKAEMDAMWTTAATESYAGDNAAATPAQLLYMILCTVSEFSVSGTTITGKKLDGSTTAMTWTINDASSPTSRTRAS